MSKDIERLSEEYPQDSHGYLKNVQLHRTKTRNNAVSIKRVSAENSSSIHYLINVFQGNVSADIKPSIVEICNEYRTSIFNVYQSAPVSKEYLECISISTYISVGVSKSEYLWHRSIGTCIKRVSLMYINQPKYPSEYPWVSSPTITEFSFSFWFD